MSGKSLSLHLLKERLLTLGSYKPGLKPPTDLGDTKTTLYCCITPNWGSCTASRLSQRCWALRSPWSPGSCQMDFCTGRGKVQILEQGRQRGFYLLSWNTFTAACACSKGFSKNWRKKKSHCLGQACKFYRHQVLSCRHTAPLRCSISRGYPMQVGLGLAPLGEQLVRNLWARTCLKVSQARAARCRGEMCQYFTFLWWMWLVRDFSVCASGFSSSVYNTSSAQQCMEIDLQASMRLFLWVRAT